MLASLLSMAPTAAVALWASSLKKPPMPEPEVVVGEPPPLDGVGTRLCPSSDVLSCGGQQPVSQRLIHGSTGREKHTYHDDVAVLHEAGLSTGEEGDDGQHEAGDGQHDGDPDCSPHLDGELWTSSSEEV